MNNSTLIALFSLLLMASPVVAASVGSDGEWALFKEAEQVYLYSRVKADGFLEVKAQTLVRADLHALNALLRDTEIAPQWIENALAVKVLARPSDNVSIVNTQFSSPWPVRNRDMITQTELTVDTLTPCVSIAVLDIGHAYPPADGYVRMTEVTGLWTAAPAANNMIRITYTGSGNPMGRIPRWLANRLLKKATFNTFVAMREFIRRPKYQNTSIQGDVENKNL